MKDHAVEGVCITWHMLQGLDVGAGIWQREGISSLPFVCLALVGVGYVSNIYPPHSSDNPPKERFKGEKVAAAGYLAWTGVLLTFNVR